MPACGRSTMTATSDAQAATRDYVLELDAPAGAPRLSHIFGGKITTYRRLAEAALDRLAAFSAEGRQAWSLDGEFSAAGRRLCRLRESGS